MNTLQIEGQISGRGFIKSLGGAKEQQSNEPIMKHLQIKLYKDQRETFIDK